MSTSVVDMDLLDINDGKNPFEEIMSKLEHLSLQGTFIDHKEEMEKTLLFLERKYQDYHDADEEKSNWIAEAVLANYMILDAEIVDLSIVNENLNNIRNFANDLSSCSNDLLQKYSISHFISTTYKNSKSLPKDKFLKAYHLAYDFTKNENESYKDWTLEINFETNDHDKHVPLEFIYTLIEGLNTIEGVEARLEDIKIGSIKARINVGFTSQEGKEEFKNLLSALQGSGIEDVSEVVSSHQSGEKSILQPNSESNLEHLNRQSIELDIERKRLENDALRFRNFADRKNILAELLRDGIITQRNFQLLIKGIPFMKWEDGEITIGESIDVIDNL